MAEAPRLKTEIWVQAFLRSCAGRGQYGAVIYKGSPEAGALYIAVNHLDGSFDLLEPPPGPAHDEKGERLFSLSATGPKDWAGISERILKRRRIDPDLWLVEIEDRDGLAGLQHTRE